MTLLMLGILMPLASAALAGLGLADGRVMVICTGDGLRTIRIDENGEPVDVAQEAELCALVHAADTSDFASPATTLPRLLYAADRVLPASLPRAARSFFRSLPRAPPMV